MLTFAQLKGLKAKRKELTQAQIAQIVTLEAARQCVRQMISDTLTVDRIGIPPGELDRIFTNQPVHWDEMGYVPHWFERQFIWQWAMGMWESRFKSAYEQKRGGTPV